MTRPRLVRPVTAIALALAAALLALPEIRPAVAQAPVPPDFQMTQAESSPGTVTFSHRVHLGKVEKCSTCHMKDFRMKRGASGPITLSAKQDGKFCGSCHDGKPHGAGSPVFPIDECDRCHK